MSPRPPLPAGRSRRDSGWRLVGLLGLLLVTLVWMPLGARDAAGVSSVLPALRPVILSQPGGGAVAGAIAGARPAAHPARPSARGHVTPVVLAGLLIALALAVVAVRRRSCPDRWPPPSAPALALGSRAPPSLV